jgi:hypothetical protein
MAKITLGNAPKSFKRKVTFPLVDGGQGDITVNFKYRTRKQFGEFIDGIMGEAKATKPPEDQEFSMLTLMDKTGESNAKYILDVADGWDLEEEFNADNLARMSDMYPAAAVAIMDTYRLAVTEGRLGN